MLLAEGGHNRATGVGSLSLCAMILSLAKPDEIGPISSRNSMSQSSPRSNPP